MMDSKGYDLLDLVDHPVFVLERSIDHLPRYAAFNEHACAVLGKTRGEILGLTALDLYGGRLGEIALEHHEKAFCSGMTRSYELTLPIRNAERRVRTTLKPEQDASGRVLRVVGTSLDISNDHMFQEARTEYETMASEIEDFISIAAHDLRAPMLQVKMLCEMLREDFTDMGDGKLDLIDMLEQIGAKSMRLISDVLAQAQAATAEAQVVVFEFGEMVQDILLTLDPLGQVEVRHDEARLCADRIATLVALRNLVDNALKYAGTDRAQITLDISVLPNAAGFFTVRVRDNGKGFDAAGLELLDGGKLRTDSGFGLFGVRRLIAARGGRLTVANRPDRSGSEVSFSLPGVVASRTTFAVSREASGQLV